MFLLELEAGAKLLSPCVTHATRSLALRLHYSLNSKWFPKGPDEGQCTTLGYLLGTLGTEWVLECSVFSTGETWGYPPLCVTLASRLLSWLLLKSPNTTSVGLCSWNHVLLTRYVLVELSALSCSLHCRLAEDLLKDINNMLSDFSTELDSMFEWMESWILSKHGNSNCKDRLNVTS